MNKITKKVMSLIISIMIIIGSVQGIQAASQTKEYPQKFYDVPQSHWAFEYIAELTDRGVISGYEDNSFKPNKTVTRAEFARIMVGAAGINTYDNDVYFNDMQNHWAIPYVNAASDYLTAYSDNSYRPDQAAVREDVTMAMVKLKGYDISDVDFSYLSGFNDVDSISSNIRTYVAVAVEKGLISGFEDNTFRGQDTLTRAEAATLLWKAFQYGSDNKIANSSESSDNKTVIKSEIGQISKTNKETYSPTAKPKREIEEDEPTPKPTPTIKPTPTPKPYVIDTVAVVESDGQMAISDDNLYYYDEDEGAIFEFDIQKEKTKKIIDIEDIQLTVDKELSDGDVIEETYKDFRLNELYYDNFHDKLLACGDFYAVTDSLSTFDNTDYYYSKVIDITDGEINTYCNDKITTLRTIIDKNNLFVNSHGSYIADYKSGKTTISIDPYIPGMSQSSIGNLYGTLDGELCNVLFFDSGMFTDKRYKSVIYKCDKSGDSWSAVNSITTAICGYHDGKLLCWDTENGQLFNVGGDGRISMLDIDTNEDVDIEDMRGIPDSSKFGTIITLYATDDNEIYFFDSNAIRVLKKRN